MILGLLLTLTTGGVFIYALCSIYHWAFNGVGVFDEDGFYYKILFILLILCIIGG